eukprot:CAMPEP_0118967784 /NCGR_PEP_ID=MMETSP1173-20130426/5130_1 /TAXON_ID=1034831 /ORGANISM="Rhizochromulina marina cf, Strain CCMP1243" /LENGTH=238 /DNA_ID=CAMNT_0006916811 /DNA_START=38 /DNA_END=754 /DNA_ORIENTATION=-
MPAWGDEKEDEAKPSRSDEAEDKGERRRRPRRLVDEEAGEKGAGDKNSEERSGASAAGKQGWGSPGRNGGGRGGGGASAAAPAKEDPEDDVPRGRRKNLRDMEDEATEILMIPDLDDEENDAEDITTQVAAAPRNLARRVQSLQQLDHDIKYTVPSGAGIDLSILTSSLVPPTMVREDDVLWEFDSLLQEVTHEFNAEVEKRAEDEAAGLVEKQEKKDAGSEVLELGVKKRGMTMMFA